MSSITTSRFLPKHTKLTIAANAFASGTYHETTPGKEPGSPVVINKDSITVIESSIVNRQFTFTSTGILTFIQNFSRFQETAVVIDDVTVLDTDEQLARQSNVQQSLVDIVVGLKRIELQLEKITGDPIDEDDVFFDI